MRARLVTDKGRNNSVGHYIYQKHYRLDPPLDGIYADVVVSAADVPYSGPETFIFGANEKGEISDWGELPGSYRGGLDHEQALRNAGYTVDPLADLVEEND